MKFRFKYLIFGTRNQYRIISDKGLLIAIVCHSGLEDDEENSNESKEDSRIVQMQTNESSIQGEWDWKGHEDYWPLDFHTDSLLNEPVYHLKNVFFFNPLVKTSFIKPGTYKVFIHHGADPNCNLLD
jgi:hypothetical protein